MLARPTARGLLAASLCLAATAAPASAAVNIDTFGVTPSSTAAGGNADFRLQTAFSYAPTSDDLDDVKVSLPAGLLANPTVAAPCSELQLAANACPASTLVAGDDTPGGTNTVTADVQGFGVMVLETKAYLVAPQGSEAARVGLVIIGPFGTRITKSVPVTVRTSPSFGLDIHINDLPRDGFGFAITVRAMDLTLKGTVNGKAFTRLPTSCGQATTTLSASNKDAPIASDTATSSFTPTGCGALPFAPALSATATKDATGDGVAFTSTIAQAVGQAAQKAARLTFPAGLSPRLTSLGNICTTPAVTSCPASSSIGAASAITPLLPSALAGRMFLRQASPFPNIVIVFPPPFAIQLTGATSLGSGGLSAAFAGVPDVPLSSLKVSLAGGAKSLLAASDELCTGIPVLRGEFTAHSGRTATANANVAVTGCKPARPKGRVRWSGLARGRPKMTLTLTAPKGGKINRADLRLPRGLRAVKKHLTKHLKVKAGTKTLRNAGRKRKGGVRITAEGGRSKLTITLRWPALEVSRRLARRAARQRKPTLTLTAKVRTTAGKTTTLKIKGKGR